MLGLKQTGCVGRKDREERCGIFGRRVRTILFFNWLQTQWSCPGLKGDSPQIRTNDGKPWWQEEELIPAINELRFYFIS